MTAGPASRAHPTLRRSELRHSSAELYSARGAGEGGNKTARRRNLPRDRGDQTGRCPDIPQTQPAFPLAAVWATTTALVSVRPERAHTLEAARPHSRRWARAVEAPHWTTTVAWRPPTNGGIFLKYNLYTLLFYNDRKNKNIRTLCGRQII